MSNDLADRSRLHRKCNQELDANLAAGEKVEVVITGPSNQAIIGTDRRMFVYKKGFMAEATFGSQLTSWDYRNVVGVLLHTGMMSGAVVIQAAGTKTSSWGLANDEPFIAPNAIPVVRPFDQAKAGVAALRQLIETSHREPLSSHEPPAAPRTASVADELKKLADLHAAGVLSDDEFASLKSRLLS